MTAGPHALIERAWEARTDRTRIKHARAAIAADPDQLDGYVLLGQSLPDAGDRLAILREGASRGRILWAAAMKRPAQSWFWADIDTRPFMRLLHLLAVTLWDSGDRIGALREAKLLLRLNRNDNQGIRELLAAWYPAVGEWDALAKLLHRYREDWSASHHYTRWLLVCHRGEDSAAALSDALDTNPHVPMFLADPTAEPEPGEGPLAMMGYVTMGSAGEAHGYADAAREGWLRVPGAIERLVRDAAGVAKV